MKSDKVGYAVGNQKESVRLVVPVSPMYVGVVRMTVAAIANRHGFDIEAIEDIKIAVTEAVTNVVVHCQSCDLEGIDIQICFDNHSKKLAISVSDEGCGFEACSTACMLAEYPSEEGGMGLFIINSLMDEVDLHTQPGWGTRIIMKKKLGEG